MVVPYAKRHHMKRIKFTFVVVAAVLSIGGAFASNKWKAACEIQQQYIYTSGLGYVPVSEDYYCYQVPNVCTYYISTYVPEVYSICAYGTYIDPPDEGR